MLPLPATAGLASAGSQCTPHRRLHQFHRVHCSLYTHIHTCAYLRNQIGAIRSFFVVLVSMLLDFAFVIVVVGSAYIHSYTSIRLRMFFLVVHLFAQPLSLGAYEGQCVILVLNVGRIVCEFLCSYLKEIKLYFHKILRVFEFKDYYIDSIYSIYNSSIIEIPVISAIAKLFFK